MYFCKFISEGMRLRRNKIHQKFCVFFAIEEGRDLSSMTLEELICSLRTFEMGVPEEDTPKRKRVAFVATNDQINKRNSADEEELMESYALLTGNLAMQQSSLEGEEIMKNIPPRLQNKHPSYVVSVEENETSNQSVKIKRKRVASPMPLLIVIMKKVMTLELRILLLLRTLAKLILPKLMRKI